MNSPEIKTLNSELAGSLVQGSNRLEFSLSGDQTHDIYRLVACRDDSSQDAVEGKLCVSFLSSTHKFEHKVIFGAKWFFSLYGCKLDDHSFSSCEVIFSKQKVFDNSEMDSVPLEMLLLERQRFRNKLALLKWLVQNRNLEARCNLPLKPQAEIKQQIEKKFAHYDEIYKNLIEGGLKPQASQGLALAAGVGGEGEYSVKLYLMRPKEFVKVNMDIPFMEQVVAGVAIADQVKSIVKTGGYSVGDISAAASDLAKYELGFNLGAVPIMIDIADTVEHVLPNVQARVKSPVIHPATLALSPGVSSKLITHSVREAAGLNFELGMEISNGDEKYYFSGSGVRTLESDLEMYDDWRSIEIDQKVSKQKLQEIFADQKLKSTVTLLQASNSLFQYDTKMSKILDRIVPFEHNDTKALVKRALVAMTSAKKIDLNSLSDLNSEFDKALNVARLGNVTSGRIQVNEQMLEDVRKNMDQSVLNEFNLIREMHADLKSNRVGSHVAALKYNKFNNSCTQQVCNVLKQVVPEGEIEKKLLDTPRKLYRRVKETSVSQPEEIALGEKKKWYKHVSSVKITALEDTRALIGVRNIEKIASEKTGKSLPQNVNINVIDSPRKGLEKLSSFGSSAFGGSSFNIGSSSSTASFPYADQQPSLADSHPKKSKVRLGLAENQKPLAICPFNTFEDLLEYQAHKWIMLDNSHLNFAQ